MREFNPQSNFPPTVLATDLDGTFIPLEGDPDNIAALERIKNELDSAGVQLIYATGRHLESVESAVGAYQLPIPGWMICDVGTSIYQIVNGAAEIFKPYEEHLLELVGGRQRTEIENLMKDVTEITLQSAERQQRFKVSYECGSVDLEPALQELNHRINKDNLPYSVIGSIDPFENCGLLDILPAGVSKAYAVTWLAQHAGYSPDAVVFAGDSGNDKAALISGFRAIVVGNASKSLADEVLAALKDKGWQDRYYRASGTATSGVLEGCRHYGMFPA